MVAKTRAVFKNNAIGIYLGLFLILVGLLLHEAYLSLVVDDAFISFRYAKNVADGYGFVFNAGERVEGYSNFLWVLIMSWALKLGYEPLAAARIIGKLFSAMTLIVAFKLSEKVIKSKSYINLTAPLIIATNGSFAAWAVSGLESPLFAFLIAVAIYFFLTEDDKVARAAFSGVSLGLAALTRPEGAFVFVLALIFRIILIALKRKKIRNFDFAFVLGFIAIFLPFFIWRFMYFGYFFPNTFYAKNGSNLGLARFGYGFKYAMKFFSGYGLLVPLTLFSLLLFIGKTQRRTAAYLLWIVCVYTLYIINVGGDSQRFSRFFVPLVFPIAILIQEGLR